LVPIGENQEQRKVPGEKSKETEDAVGGKKFLSKDEKSYRKLVEEG